MFYRKHVKEPDIYRRNGYKNRMDYLEAVAEDYGVASSVVIDQANLLGKEEDFDGLISHMEDFVC